MALVLSTKFWLIGLELAQRAPGSYRPRPARAVVLAPGVRSAVDLVPQPEPGAVSGAEDLRPRPQVATDLDPNPQGARDLRPRPTSAEEE